MEVYATGNQLTINIEKGTQMSNASLHVFDAELKQRVQSLADRYDMSMSSFAASLLKEQIDKIEREWARIERQVNRISAMSDEQLEAEEVRLLDRLHDLSEPEEAYLNAVQDELTARSKQPARSKAAA